MKHSNPATITSSATRPSLLRRVRSWEDQTSWAEFYKLYWKLVYGLARRSGLAHADAEDVCQEVFKRVAETIGNFESDPNRGTFRGWLMNLTRWRIADKYAARPKAERRGSRSSEGTSGSRTATIERVPDGSDPNANWNQEWKLHLIEAACERIAKRTKEAHYRAFDLHVRNRWPVEKVAAELGIRPGAVYLICHRLTKQLKAEVAKLRKQLG